MCERFRDMDCFDDLEEGQMQEAYEKVVAVVKGAIHDEFLERMEVLVEAGTCVLWVVPGRCHGLGRGARSTCGGRGALAQPAGGTGGERRVALPCAVLWPSRQRSVAPLAGYRPRGDPADYTTLYEKCATAPAYRWAKERGRTGSLAECKGATWFIPAPCAPWVHAGLTNNAPDAAGGCGSRRSTHPGAPTAMPTSRPPSAPPCAPWCWRPAATRAWAACHRTCCTACLLRRPTRCQLGGRSRSSIGAATREAAAKPGAGGPTGS